MAIDLQTFASGDTDYIAKLNSDMSQIEDAINALLQAQGGQAGSYSIGQFLTGLFQAQSGLIGMNSYKPVASSSTEVMITAGAFYKGALQVVVATGDSLMSFAGQTPGTYYIVPDASGAPARVADEDPDAAWSLYWSGSSFGAITRLAPALFNIGEENEARLSTALAVGTPLQFQSLDARLEQGESTAKTAAAAAQETADNALAAVLALGSSVDALAIRRVCITVDGGTSTITNGVKGSIQVDFNGEIIGWSATADVVGDIEIDVSKASSYPPDEPPTIPDPDLDKISASAPILIVGAKSAAENAAGVASWNTEIFQWDVLQFTVVAATAIKRVTVVVRIQETPAS